MFWQPSRFFSPLRSASGSIRTIGMALCLLAPALLSACKTSEPAYTSGQVGTVDCKDFRIQSLRPEFQAPAESKCVIARTDDVEVNGTAFVREFKAQQAWMHVFFERLAPVGHFVLAHSELPGPLMEVEQIKKESSDWEALPPLEVSGERYQLSRFRLPKVGIHCVAFLANVLHRDFGYEGRVSGYSCRPQKKGALSMDDVRRELEALRVAY